MRGKGHSRTVGIVTLLIASLSLTSYLVFALAQKIRVTFPDQRARRVSPNSSPSVILKSGDNLQRALDKAKPGDTIMLEAGATFVGPFVLPKKTGDSFITIQSSRLSELPSDRRVNPSHSPLMPKIISGSGSRPAVQTAPYAHHYKFVGVEFLPSDQSTALTLVLLDSDAGQSPSNLAPVPHNIIIDRCYIHSLPKNLSIVRGIALNSSDSKVVNSYISEIHGTSTDSQAIFAWNGPGRLTIENNYLEASSECLQLGYTTADNIPPDNVTIARNHLARPLAWRRLYGNVKNLFEMKGGTNVTFSGNLLENNWADGQSGHAIVLSAYYNDINHVTITNNLIRHVGAAFSIGGSPNLGGLVDHIIVSNNLIDDINATTYNNPWTGAAAGGFLLQIGPSSHVTFDHNTNAGGYGIAISGNDFAISPHFTFTNNIAGCVNGIGILESVAKNSGVMKNNLQPWFSGGHSGTESVYGFENAAPTPPVPKWPQVTLYPSLRGSMFWFTEKVSQVGFVDPSGNYQLAGTSLYKGKGTDGKDIGADFTTLNTALGVLIASAPTTTP